jgi:hypothetical protein
LSEVPPWETWIWEVPEGTTAASLADTIEQSTADLLVALASLSPEALSAPGRFDRWSGHDLLAHCVAWAEVCARILGELVAGTLDLRNYRDLPVGDESEDDLNQRQVDELADVPTDVLVERLERAMDQAAEALRRFEGEPPTVLVLMTFGDHFDDHAAAFREAASA